MAPWLFFFALFLNRSSLTDQWHLQLKTLSSSLSTSQIGHISSATSQNKESNLLQSVFFVTVTDQITHIEFWISNIKFYIRNLSMTIQIGQTVNEEKISKSNLILNWYSTLPSFILLLHFYHLTSERKDLQSWGENPLETVLENITIVTRQY